MDWVSVRLDICSPRLLREAVLTAQRPSPLTSREPQLHLTEHFELPGSKSWGRLGGETCKPLIRMDSLPLWIHYPFCLASRLAQICCSWWNARPLSRALGAPWSLKQKSSSVGHCASLSYLLLKVPCLWSKCESGGLALGSAQPQGNGDSASRAPLSGPPLQTLALTFHGPQCLLKMWYKV